ncbi:MAG: M14 family metallopeptidase [Bauldia sp.]
MNLPPVPLDFRDGFPEALLDLPAPELWRQLPGPALFKIAGRDAAPLFVSVLLHGNEHSGWDAIRMVLRDRDAALPPRPLLLFVGNIEAARAGVRTLPGQDDFNRVWPGTADTAAPLSRLMREVVEAVRRERPFASIDIHNNTGRNPHYACVNGLSDEHLHLARLFGRTVVHFTQPTGVQSAAMTGICPAVTVECGRAVDAAGAEHAAAFIRAVLALHAFPEHKLPPGEIDLLRTFAVVKVPADAGLSFDGAEADFRFRGDLDALNFCELAPGTPFGSLGGSGAKRLDLVAAEPGGDPAPWFDYTGGAIRLARAAVPSMLTVDERAVRLDCLGYLMRRIGRDGRPL